jgi:5'-nucleotidase
VLSGVNRGQNLADDMTYSGTVAGAIEGTLLGIRSIALSQAYGFGARDACRYETTEALAPQLISRLIKSSWPAQTLMNINFPDLPPDEVKGTLLTKQGKRLPDLLHIDKRNDGRGFPYYWIGFKPQEHKLVDGTDLKAVIEGYVSVTPLQLDLTDHSTLTKLRMELTND